jgi:serine/threonine protein phosphatase PrpC
MSEEFTNEPAQADPPAEQPAEQSGEQAASTAPAADAAANVELSLRAEAEPIRILVSALSDIGCVRTNNEDFLGFDESLGIFVVCDGMGGMASGEVASSRAVAAILESFASSTTSGLPVSTRLLHAITMANEDVWENGQIPENRGMGTTVVTAALDGNKLIIGNVGDSRAYIVKDGQTTQLTVDHSYINELIRNGTLTIETSHTVDLQGMESIITRAVGVSADVQPDFFSVDLTPGTGILLATDGLTRYVAQEEITAILSASTFETACASLIQIAKDRGGQDNVSCIFLLVIPA